ncbi:tripartite tricarboxylate transporter substrate binding protein [Ramlibacter sp. AW1]|uniref:Tripartite tricarboxylate transporter substrate binding protein n=1 Tax=Ramlibacter aurantiacus TaxID=2801330 RepID=A0A937D587_9BURK|nr:tripartite tricarboxylate transporter substrate binding protein [Ramlibacter aurantiacus]MBL0419648.1 tripartite tricarboxylate transporter substrate binding protein [Ramlibacter aurantiacus]
MSPSLARRRLLTAAASLAAAALLHSPAAWAQGPNWPTRPVKLVVPFPAGTAPDVAARLLADKLSQGWGQSVVVDNRPGAGAIPGMVAAARSAPDGYTIAFVPAAAATITPFVHKNPQYDINTDFVAVAPVATAPMMIVVDARSDVHNLADLARLSRSKPGKLNFAAAQVNSLPHLTGAMLDRLGKLGMFTVPYQGSPAAVNGVLGGDALMTIDGIAGLVQHVKAGKLRALAITSDKRLPGFEDIPTASETYKGFESVGWFGLFVPTGTPQPIVDAINAHTNKAMANPDLVQRFAELGMYPRTGSAASLKDFTQEQQQLFKRWVAELGLQAQ